MIRDILMRWLGKTDPPGTFVAESEWSRCEELRPDRLGLTEDVIIEEDPEWEPPADAWRPRNTLG